MNPKHLATLEYPKVLERLARHTSFPASRNLALALMPSPYLSEALQWKAETGEARRLLAVKPETGIGGARDVRPLLDQATRMGILLPGELLDVRQTLVSARNLKRVLVAMEDQYPYLADMAGRIVECQDLVNEIGHSISDRGDVLDGASAALARIRGELETAHQRLMERLNRIVQSADNGPYLQEAYVTQRQGRYVIPLRAEFKGRIAGVVHDQSASGATLFVEPLATVELNNRWRQLQMEEEQEIQRVLAALSEMVRREADHIRWSVEAIADLDLALAKGRYAEDLLATEPAWEVPAAGKVPGDATFDLREARHPLLDPQSVVPVHVTLEPGTRILVITGPNTGGKTVALKTIGLVTAMAQSGLFIPAKEGSLLPYFHDIFADIGDEQSIEQSLSTFSAHMTNIVGILDQCDDRSLVIMDELGAGTDPVEGAALARAILDFLNAKHAKTFVATHYSDLKAYAHQTPAAVNACVEFDADTLAPTYRLTIGLPGRSNAFAIARRLGLNPAIIKDAQESVAPESQQTESLLLDIQAQREAAARDRRAAATALTQIERHGADLDAQLAQVESERRRVLNETRAQARQEIETVRQELRELERSWRERTSPPAQQGNLPTSEQPETALSALEELVMDVPAPDTQAPKSAYRGPLRPGDPVWVRPYNAAGEVIASRRGEVEVQVGRFRTTVRRNQVDSLKSEATENAQEPVGIDSGDWREGLMPSTESPGMELDMRGQTSDEGLHRLGLYLDNAYLAGLPWVRIIHGRGSGVLRTVVRDALRNHPLVTSFRPGEENEGGDGVTVAKLATG